MHWIVALNGKIKLIFNEKNLPFYRLPFYRFYRFFWPFLPFYRFNGKNILTVLPFTVLLKADRRQPWRTLEKYREVARVIRAKNMFLGVRKNQVFRE